MSIDGIPSTNIYSITRQNSQPKKTTKNYTLTRPVLADAYADVIISMAVSELSMDRRCKNGNGRMLSLVFCQYFVRSPLISDFHGRTDRWYVICKF